MDDANRENATKQQPPPPDLVPLQRLRRMAVTIALAMLGVTAIIVFIFSRVVAHGLLLGGVAGILAFWIVAVRVEKLAQTRPNQVEFAAFRWTIFRLLLYAMALGRAYLLDQESMHGLLAAVAGLFFIRFALIFLAFTGLDLKQNKK